MHGRGQMDKAHGCLSIRWRIFEAMPMFRHSIRDTGNYFAHFFFSAPSSSQFRKVYLCGGTLNWSYLLHIFFGPLKTMNGLSVRENYSLVEKLFGNFHFIDFHWTCRAWPFKSSSWTLIWILPTMTSVSCCVHVHLISLCLWFRSDINDNRLRCQGSSRRIVWFSNSIGLLRTHSKMHHTNTSDIMHCRICSRTFDTKHSELSYRYTPQCARCP